MSIGERIEELRKNLGLSQGDLAAMMGITRQAVSKWENDQSSPDTIKLIQLADILNTEVEYLATGRKPVYEHPIVVNLVKKEESVPEEKKGINPEKTIIKTRIKRVVRIKYKTNPLTLLIIGTFCFLAGLLMGLLI